MKKLSLVFATVVMAAFVFTSCNKCVDCGDCPSGVTLSDTEICEDDFDNKDDYDAAVAIVEAFGCTCD